MLQPGCKPNLEIPGGVVEDKESPYDACVREIREEIGLAMRPQQLLCVDYQQETDEQTESLMFVFCGGKLSDEQIAQIQIDQQEILSYAFLNTAEIAGKTTDSLYRRIVQCVKAYQQESTFYLEDQEL